MKKLILTVTAAGKPIDYIELALAAIKPRVMKAELFTSKILREEFTLCLS
ncbi:MAG TPA: hypothetical protein VFX58_11055 [Chitinophagaceae bacterium]|nr:hypothetical protein [Chitinophagaceae bacterium]